MQDGTLLSEIWINLAEQDINECCRIITGYIAYKDNQLAT